MSAENHNHITRDIKPPGQCYSCDRYHAKTLQSEVTALRNIIYGTLESAEEDGVERALRYLTYEAQARNITRYE
jgi:hypothetical protein